MSVEFRTLLLPLERSPVTGWESRVFCAVGTVSRSPLRQDLNTPAMLEV